MELELKKERFECYRPGTPLISTREESAETIVPDYIPDVARIIDVSACLLLRSQTVSEGRLNLEGTIRLTLLFLAEGTQGLRSLEYSIPFEQSERLPDGCEKASAVGRACGVEARLLNPRKLFTRLDVEWRIVPYCRETLSVCSEISEREKYAVETLSEKHEVTLIRAIGEKDFVFADELTIPGGREAVRELLCTRVKPRVTEAKSIGSKAVVKGVACVSLLYTAEDGSLCSYAEELPFSQLLDGVAGEEGGDVSAEATLNLTGCEIHTGAEGESGAGRTVSVKLFMNAFVVLRGTETIQCITDLYSTAYDLNAQTERIELWHEPETLTVTQSVREQLDTGTEVKCVLTTDVCCGSVGVRQDGEKAVLYTTAAVSVLYLDDSDAPRAVSRRIEITAESAMSGDVQVGTVCTGDISANINANGIELRFPVDFTVVSNETASCACLTELSAGEQPEAAGGVSAPSLVLRALKDGETLWDVAKQYRTTIGEILSANELSGSAAAEVGQMLLIPRKR